MYGERPGYVVGRVNITELMPPPWTCRFSERGLTLCTIALCTPFVPIPDSYIFTDLTTHGVCRVKWSLNPYNNRNCNFFSETSITLQYESDASYQFILFGLLF